MKRTHHLSNRPLRQNIVRVQPAQKVARGPCKPFVQRIALTSVGLDMNLDRRMALKLTENLSGTVRTASILYDHLQIIAFSLGNQ